MIINGIEFFEDASSTKSPDENFAVDSARVVRSFWFRNATQVNRFAAAKALLGWQAVQEETVGSIFRRWITRMPPHGYAPVVDPVLNPDNRPYLWAISIPRGEPLGKPTGAAAEVSSWESYRFSGVEYRALPWYVKTDAEVLAPTGPLAEVIPFLRDLGTALPARPDEGAVLEEYGWPATRSISKFVEMSARTSTLRHGALRFVSWDQGLVAEGVIIKEARASIRYIHHQVPILGVPWKSISTCLGTVNDVRFDGHEPGTLLLETMRFRPLQGPLGDRLCELEFSLSWAPNERRYPQDGVTKTQMGHNAVLAVRRHPDNNERRLDYYEVVDDVEGQPMCRSSAFASLFRPDQEP